MIRKSRAFLAAVIWAALLWGCSSPATMPADPTAQRLVGRWSQVFSFSGVRDEIAIDLEADATMRVKVKRHSGSGTQEYTGAGKWRVDDGNFVGEFAFGGPADAVDHLSGRQRIVAVTEWQWVSEFRNRAQLTAWRYPK